MKRARKSIFAGLATLGVLVTCSFFVTGTAFGSRTHVYSGHGIGPTGLDSGSFVSVQSIAVDQRTGDIYVYDVGASAIYKYNASGEPLSFSALGSNVIEGVRGSGGGENEIAVDDSSGPAQGDIYVVEEPNGGSALRTYNAAGELLEAILLRGGAACGVAVDASGNLYTVNFGAKLIRQYVPTTNLVASSDEIASLETGDEIVNGPCNIAVGGEGDIYVAKWKGSVSEYSTSQFGLPFAVGGKVIDPVGRTLAVDRVSNEVYVDEGSDIVQYGSTGRLLETSGEGVIDRSEGGVAVVAGGRNMYAADGKGRVAIFGPTVVVPDVAPQAASRLRQTSATLNGNINPDGTSVSTCEFEYGPSQGVYEHVVACSQTLPLSGSSPTAVTAEVSGLTTGTIYHYRLVASNENGANRSGDHAFTTSTFVEGLSTGPAEEVGQHSVKLSGSIAPDGTDAHYYFEYGPDSSYGSVSPAPPGVDAGSGGEGTAETSLTGLRGHTTYHYRLVGVNSLGTSYGEDQTFTTLSAPPVVEGATTTSITSSSALVSGTLNAEHSETSCYVEYVQESDFLPLAADPYSAGARSSACNVGAGDTPQTVGPVSLQGLLAGTTYHYAFVAKNQAGLVIGGDAQFTTQHGLPPSVITGGAESIGQNVASISATINSNDSVTTYGFEIGTDANDYGPPTGLGAVGSGADNALVTLGLTGLQPGTTYHYRVTATSVGGTGYGADETFTTGVYPTTFATPPAPLPFVTVPSIAFPVGSQANTGKPKAKAKPKAKKSKPRVKRKRRTDRTSKRGITRR